MTIAHDTEHVARGVGRLIERYRKPRTSALLTSWLLEVQAVEDVLYDLLLHIIDRQIDVQGKLVGQPREGWTTAVYKLWIAARILVNRSSGTPPELVRIVRTLGASGIVFEEQYPAAAVIHTAFDGPMGAQVAKLLQLAKDGGVALYFHWWWGTAPFRFASGGSIETGAAGFNQGTWSSISQGEDVVFWEPTDVPDDVLTDEEGEPLTSDDDDDYLLTG